jgi:hypothetical protein
MSAHTARADYRIETTRAETWEPGPARGNLKAIPDARAGSTVQEQGLEIAWSASLSWEEEGGAVGAGSERDCLPRVWKRLGRQNRASTV